MLVSFCRKRSTLNQSRQLRCPQGNSPEDAVVAPRQLRAGTLDTWDFRQAVGAFTTGVTVVTTCDEAGVRYGLTANSFASVSLEPPLVLFCVDQRAPSLDGFNRSRHFAINVLAADQEPIAKRFARRADDKFAGLDWRVGIFGAPLLDRCIAHIECTFEHLYPSGDHAIVIGRVHRVRVYQGEPLIFHRSRFGTVVADTATG
jgi:flavin reductase (DIM6/NTAB) family NADH-FMN oxidoreductase RutF